MSANSGGSGRSIRVAIVGGGASGAFVAANLLRSADPRLEITVIEPRAEIGPGVAYSTLDPWHRLNVPAISMSALPDDTDHFHRWAGIAPEAFARRVDYGRYLQAVLAEADAGSPVRLRHLRSMAERLDAGGAGVRVTVAGGEVVEADAVVLATGVETPMALPALAAVAGGPRVIADPWPQGSLDGIEDGETVAILGSSLTAIDVAGSILTRHPRARVLALSRNGDLPRRHEDPWRPRFPEPAFTIEEFRAWDDPLAQAVARIRGFGDDWPRAIDSIRPISQALWIGMDEALRRSFVDSYRHVFDIHRHRVAAEVARDLDTWVRDGRLSVQAAPIERVERTPDDRLRILAHPGAGASPGGPRDLDWIVVAVGPNTDPAANPLLGAAIRDGLLRPGPLGISIDSDPVTCRVLGANGTTSLPVYAIGALRRGVLWDTLAIPEIREQSATIARQLLPS
jgi:uncharacterized NAD(P)/FAD-binding protein YdhS